MKLEMAKFLQETVQEIADKERHPNVAQSTVDFTEAFRKTRLTGEPLSFDQIVSLSRRISDAITIENIPRAQLVSLCKYMSINAFGTDSFLRFQIRSRMKQIRRDDELIDQEGVESLTEDELVHACHSRGIKSIGTVSRAHLVSELKQWLDLHLRTEIPSVLLILSRALTLNAEDVQPAEALQSAIQSLPEEVVGEVKLEASEQAGDRTEALEQKLQVLEQQEDLIAEELAQESEAREVAQDEGKAPEAIENLSEAISVLSGTDPVLEEKSQLEELKEDIAEFNEDVRTKTTKVIEEQVKKLVDDIDSELKKFTDEVGSRLQVVQADENGQLTTEQIDKILSAIRASRVDKDRIAKIIKEFDTDGDGKVFVADILRLAQEAEEQEGEGVLLEDKEEKTQV